MARVRDGVAHACARTWIRGWMQGCSCTRVCMVWMRAGGVCTWICEEMGLHARVLAHGCVHASGLQWGCMHVHAQVSTHVCARMCKDGVAHVWHTWFCAGRCVCMDELHVCTRMCALMGLHTRVCMHREARVHLCKDGVAQVFVHRDVCGHKWANMSVSVQGGVCAFVWRVAHVCVCM